MAIGTLLDANVLLRLLSQSDAQHALALNAAQAELADQTELNRSRSSENNCLSIRREVCSIMLDGTAGTPRPETKTYSAAPARQACADAAATHPV